MHRDTTRRATRLLAGTLLLLAATAADTRAQTTIVIIVRHAEKLDESTDTRLSPAGLARAEALSAALEHAGVESVLTTQYHRTRETAAPLARTLGVEPVVVTSAGNAAAHAAEVADHIRQHEAGRTVLVVGHSNTVPAIVRALGGPDIGRIEDDEYDNMVVVLIGGSGSRVVRARY